MPNGLASKIMKDLCAEGFDLAARTKMDLHEVRMKPNDNRSDLFRRYREIHFHFRSFHKKRSGVFRRNYLLLIQLFASIILRIPNNLS